MSMVKHFVFSHLCFQENGDRDDNVYCNHCTKPIPRGQWRRHISGREHIENVLIYEIYRISAYVQFALEKEGANKVAFNKYPWCLFNSNTQRKQAALYIWRIINSSSLIYDNVLSMQCDYQPISKESLKNQLVRYLLT